MRRKERFVILCTLIFALLLGGCSQSDSIASEKDIRPMVESMLDALMNEDYDTCRDILADEYMQGTMRSTFRRMTVFLEGVESYELSLHGLQRNIFNLKSHVTARYYIDAGDRQFYVDTSYSSELDQLTSFVITEAESIAESNVLIATSGTWELFAHSDWLQKGLLIFYLLEVVFVLFSFLHCLRQPIRRKWLWLLLILLGMGLFAVNIAPGSFRTQVGLATIIHYTALMRFNTGLIVLRILIPVGAILYWLEGRTHAVSPAASGNPTSE